MAHVILVHGISHQNDAADTLEADWGPGLAGGVRNAGVAAGGERKAAFAAIADRLWGDRAVADRFDVRVAFYALPFREPGRQGGDEEVPPELRASADELALAYLLRAAQAPDAELQRAAKEELAALGLLDGGERLGVRSIQRKLVARLARLPWLAGLGMPLATWWNRNLAQVTRYLREPGIRKPAQEAVLEHVDEQTKVIVAHSLGSVMAYEACFRLAEKRTSPLPLLVTIGSPLGLANVVYHQLRPQPPVFPPLVQRWVNVADRNDIVAAEPDLGSLFGCVPQVARFDAAGEVHNGPDAHSARAYLTAVQVGGPVGEALSGF